jgi:hypothetical protein
VTFAFVTFRIGQTALVGAGIPIGAAVSIMAWACWAVPLLVTELLLQGRKLKDESAQQSKSRATHCVNPNSKGPEVFVSSVLLGDSGSSPRKGVEVRVLFSA